jgi:tetratricopeptide (TPR) repeat protein
MRPMPLPHLRTSFSLTLCCWTVLLGAGAALADPAPTAQPATPAPAAEAGPPGSKEQAKAKAKAKALVREAELQYKLGRFEEALASYTKAYEHHAVPALLFNIGQCHRQLRRFERAIFFFEGFLRETSGGPNRELAAELIAESDQELAKERRRAAEAEKQANEERERQAQAAALEQQQQQRAPQRPAEGGAGTPPNLDAPAAGVAAPVLVTTGDAAPADAGVPIYQRWWFWTAAALVAAGAVVVALSVGGEEKLVLPGGSTGTLDRR